MAHRVGESTFFLIKTTSLNIILKYNFLIPREIFPNLLNYYKIVFNFVVLDIVVMNILF